jgi:hypothetical protein
MFGNPKVLLGVISRISHQQRFGPEGWIHSNVISVLHSGQVNSQGGTMKRREAMISVALGAACLATGITANTQEKPVWPSAGTPVSGGNDKVKCAGINPCKGQGYCKSAANACRGQNTCKGHGYLVTTAADCIAKGGHEIK